MLLQLEHLALRIIYQQTPVTDSVPHLYPQRVTDHPAPDKPPSVSSKAPPILQPKHWGASELEAKRGHSTQTCLMYSVSTTSTWAERNVQEEFLRDLLTIPGWRCLDWATSNSPGTRAEPVCLRCPKKAGVHLSQTPSSLRICVKK